MKLQVFLLCLFILSSCAPSSPSVFSLATYNCYALFDSVADGDEFEGFRKSDGYTEAVYNQRIRDLAVLLGKYVNTDVMILEEVESEIVLSDLIENGLKKKGYFYYGLASDGSSPIAVGFISKLKPVSVRMHSFEGERPLLELSFLIDGTLFTIFGVHLRSRLEESGAEVRKGQLEHLRSLIEARSDSFIIVAGDFNIDPRRSDEPLSLYPDVYNSDTVISVTADPGRVGKDILYSPILSEDVSYSMPGTYFYENAWHIYDMILSSIEGVDGFSFDLDELEIIAEYEMLDLLSRPLSFDCSTGRGFSDHLPVIATFRKIV